MGSLSEAQFKRTPSEEPKVSSSIIAPSTSSDWFRLLSLENLQMRQSYSMSYMTSSGFGLALGRYTNSMFYRISDKVDAQLDLTLQHSPYSTLDQRLQNSLGGLFVDRAQINYRPTDNMLFSISYRQIPWSYFSYYLPYGFYSPYRGLSTGLEFDPSN
jgi:hypothetical protein